MSPFWSKTFVKCGKCSWMEFLPRPPPPPPPSHSPGSTSFSWGGKSVLHFQVKFLLATKAGTSVNFWRRWEARLPVELLRDLPTRVDTVLHVPCYQNHSLSRVYQFRSRNPMDSWQFLILKQEGLFNLGCYFCNLFFPIDLWTMGKTYVKKKSGSGEM